MALTLDVLHQEQLRALLELDADTTQEFCKVAFQFMQDGFQAKMTEKAAKKLRWTPEKMQMTLEAIMELFRDAARIKVSREDLDMVLDVAGLPRDRVAVMVEFYFSCEQEIYSILAHLSFDNIRIRNLEWRFEVEIASRAVHNQFKPVFLIQLELGKKENQERHTLQMDIPTLHQVTEELERALQEIKTAHVKKMMRHIK